jgi:hypothetical protein
MSINPIASGQNLATALAQSLRAMDAEATTKYPDSEVAGATWTAGLRQYHQHYNAVHGSGYGCEPSWSQRLCELLNAAGVRAEAEVQFPKYALPPGKKKQSCDLRVHTSDGPLWIEIKGSWPVCFRALPGGGVEDYLWSTYRKHLGTTAEDFLKLDRLHRPDAARLGVLLVGFDTARERLDGEVGNMVRRVGPGWTGGEIAAWDEFSYRTRARVWFWTKPAASA